MDINYIRGQVDEIILTAEELERLKQGEVVSGDRISIHLKKVSA